MKTLPPMTPEIDTLLAQIDAHRLKLPALHKTSFDSLEGLINGETSKEEVTKATSALKAWLKTMNGYLKALKAAAKGGKE